MHLKSSTLAQPTNDCSPTSNCLTAKTLVVFDAGVDHLSLLVNDLLSADILILDPDHDSVAQITSALETRQSVTSLHIVSHGASGKLCLGDTQLDLQRLQQNAGQLKSWANVLKGGDILLYGCQVADGALGYLFLQQLHQLTGANIAASASRVGQVGDRHNWSLETQIGAVHTSVVFSEQLQASYPGTLATVNFSVSETILIESQGTPFSFDFEVIDFQGPLRIRIEADQPQAITQWNTNQLNVVGIPGGLNVGIFDVSPNQDFSAFEVILDAPTASISLPIFNDFQDDSPQTFTWTASPVSPADTVNIVGNTTTQIFDTPDEAPPPEPPVVSIAGSPTLIVEDEGTFATIELTLDRPAPEGGVNISVGTQSFRGLADFDVFSPQTSFENLSPVIGFSDNTGIVVNVTAGATSASVTFPIFNDADLPSTDPGATVNDDIGLDTQTWTLDPQLAIDAGLSAALGNYVVSASAGSFNWTIVDTRGQLNPPEAVDDSRSTAEDQVLSANVLVNDTDADGDSVFVSAVNGSEANLGQAVTLASGAVVRLNADGSYSYDPNGQFDSLNGGETATDSFTYTVTDGNQTSEGVFNQDSATVNITINGVDPEPEPEPEEPEVSFEIIPDSVSEADGDSLVLNFTVTGDIPDDGITVDLVGDVPGILQEF
ncbi:MAG: DUF4347 domain-containing protein, partial [Symploca sp. SIO2G7]|nr:DUF4347 domain-containing protein [Symploca sp. SIO2G7]